MKVSARRKPKILENKAELITLMKEKPALFSFEYGGFLPYYLRGTFTVEKVKYTFHWQNYVTNTSRIQSINISKRTGYKTIYPVEVRRLLKVVKDSLATSQ